MFSMSANSFQLTHCHVTFVIIFTFVFCFLHAFLHLILLCFVPSNIGLYIVFFSTRTNISNFMTNFFLSTNHNHWLSFCFCYFFESFHCLTLCNPHTFHLQHCSLVHHIPGNLRVNVPSLVSPYPSPYSSM